MKILIIVGLICIGGVFLASKLISQMMGAF